MPFRKFWILVFGMVVLEFGPSWTVADCQAAEKSTELTREKKPEESEAKQGNLFNLIFGSAPGVPTEKGLLIIHAFHDRNGNQKKDPGEEFLRNEVSCVVDGIVYRIPAFIPALKLHQSYGIRCAPIPSSNNFHPAQSEEEIFVERRGQVFDIGLPCKRIRPAISHPNPAVGGGP
ncbi:MAG: hypothetical protein JXB25_02295 [Deltaproteobacteria bacterium]|nr:hypothetical protein [Deltaproteobacteria bacterium]